MSVLYHILKPHHIQQDKNDGCSLASALMILNAYQTSTIMDQASFRDELKESDNPWLKRVSGSRRGIYVKTFQKYFQQYIDYIGLEITVDRKWIRGLSYNTFRKYLDNANRNGTYIIFNYDGHYSPLGEVDGRDLTILDVDWDEKYGKEYKYGEGDGEYVVNVRRFYNRLRDQNRSMLVIS